MENFVGEEAAADKVRCIVGLGNPENRYWLTRHNVGQRVVASLAEALHVRMKDGNGDFLYAHCTLDDNRFILAAPLTYMNESSMAVRQIVEQFHLTASDLLIVYDDFQLPLGTLRIREEGSDGGHNGLASIIYDLQTEDIPRLRVGIAGATCPVENKKELMAEYVLSPFEKKEEMLAAEMIGHARDAVIGLVQYGMQYAMNNFNKSFVRP